MEAVVELISWYRARWEIEILFNVLKNACRIEELQLGSIERRERALALFMVVAWRTPRPRDAAGPNLPRSGRGIVL